MRKIIIAILLIISFSVKAEYGITWTKVFVAKNLKQAEKVKENFDKADIWQKIGFNQVDSIYYIELSYEDDDTEKYNKRNYCIPKRMRKNIIQISFILLEDGSPMNDGKGNYIIY